MATAAPVLGNGRREVCSSVPCGGPIRGLVGTTLRALFSSDRGPAVPRVLPPARAARGG